MNEADVIDRIDRIKNILDKPEHIAREMERSLWYAVLSAIAHDDVENPQELAMMAKQTIDLTTKETDTSTGGNDEFSW